jgi:hypothetical protein
MYSVNGRRLFGALIAFGLTVAAAAPVAAQSAAQPSGEPAVATGIDIDYAAAVAPLVSTSTSRPARFASFLRQGGSNDDSGIGFGVLGMITRTSYRADGLADFFDDRTGYGFGVWVGGNRNGRVGFVGEFIYLIRGDDDFRTKALQIPAVFHINFGSRSRDSVGGYVVVGPSFTINLSNEINGVDVDDDFAGADIGVIAGLGVEFYRVGIEGRGNWGLRNINSEGTISDTKTFTFEVLGKFAFN